MENKHIIFTDGWHPTFNPSSRMPIHHHRFVELLGKHNGILNEVPRSYGGSILRAMNIDSNGNLVVSDLNRTIRYMPWWIGASSERAISIVTTIFNVAKANRKCLVAESYQRFLDAYMLFAGGNKKLTFGEATNITNSYLYRQIYPELPEISLNSITHLTIRETMGAGLQYLSHNILMLLLEIGNILHKKEFEFLGIITEYQGIEWKLGFIAEDKTFYIETLNRPHVRNKIEISLLIELCNLGKLLLGSLLLAAVELSLSQNGYKITHYGNTYGRNELCASVLGITNNIEYWMDDKDSWNFAMIQDVNGKIYPIHLLDILGYGSVITAPITKLIKKSLELKESIIVSLPKGGGLIEALSN